MSNKEFNSLILTNADGLKPFAISLTHDLESAKDLCQETLYKALAYRDTYKPNTNIKAWLYTIMRNIFINQYRRNGRKRNVMEAVKFNQTAYTLPSELNIHVQEINKAIYNLPSIFKTACLLYLDGYKYQEIALALNEPLGTIKSRIHFAKKILQNKIIR